MVYSEYKISTGTQDDLRTMVMGGSKSESQLLKPIEVLGLPFAIKDALGRRGIYTLGDLCNRPLGQVLAFRGIGAKRLLMITNALEERGLRLSAG